jgi:hypothetical protein
MLSTLALKTIVKARKKPANALDESRSQRLESGARRINQQSQFLAHVARKSSAQTLLRASAERRYPILAAFLYQALADVTDEVIEMFDRCLADAYARAGQDLKDFRTAMAQAANEKVHLFRELARAVLDPAIADPHLRSAIYQRITPAVLRRAAAESDHIGGRARFV